MPKKEKVKIMPEEEKSKTRQPNQIDAQLKDQTLLFITEKYESAKQALTKGSVRFPIDVKALTKEYTVATRKIIESFENYKYNKGPYSIFGTAELRQKKLLSDVKKIRDDFTIMVNPITDTKLLSLIEEEENMNKLAREEEEEKQKAAERALEAERKRIEDEARAAALREQQIKDEIAMKKAANLKKLGGNAMFITSAGVEQKIRSAWF
jgi:hypothetical protein